MKIYRTCQFNIIIEECELIKETEKQVVYVRNGRENRAAKFSSWDQFHHSYEEARRFLLKREKKQKEYHEEQMKIHEDNIEQLGL